MAFNNSYNEQELIQRVIGGNERAFAKLFDHYRDKIYSAALKLTHSTVIAEEITEDVFLTIWLRRYSLNEIKSFSAYLFTIATNETYKILKQIAKNYKIVLLAENNEPIALENLEDFLITKEYSSLLQKAIQRLPKQQKQVYQLMKEEQLKRQEVAEILHIQPETVKFHLAQAMKNIRTYCMMHLSSSVGFLLFLSSLLIP